MAHDSACRDPVVSDDRDELILVDREDREIGYLSKARCHDGDGVLHRAFSLFVLDGRGHVLLQQRAPDKRLWPRYWSNACCSHPRRGEDMDAAVRRRAHEELGLVLDTVEYLYKFEYCAHYRMLGTEHELCHVYLARADAEPRPNRNEISDWRWRAPGELDDALAAAADLYTPWFRMEWQRLQSEFADRLQAVAGRNGAYAQQPPASGSSVSG